jgi:hypothetical protein
MDPPVKKDMKRIQEIYQIQNLASNTESDGITNCYRLFHIILKQILYRFITKPILIVNWERISIHVCPSVLRFVDRHCSVV